MKYKYKDLKNKNNN